MPHIFGGTVSGTSFAAPLVSGAAAILFYGTSLEELTPSKVREQLIAGAADLNDAGLGGRFLDVFESLTNAGFERDAPDGAGSASPWLESATWNDRPMTGDLPLFPFTPETNLVPPFLAPQDRDLVQIVEAFGAIDPAEGSAFALLRNGTAPIQTTTEPPPVGVRASETLDLYDTGLLHWTLFLIDLGEATELPFSFDWALVAEVPAGDVGCVGPGSDCASWTVGYPARMDLCHAGAAGEACTELAHATFDTLKDSATHLYINAFPANSISADLPITSHNAHWTGWQQVSSSAAAAKFQEVFLAFSNSPVGFRFHPEYVDGQPTGNWQEWDRDRTNFALLVDNFTLRSSP